MIGNKAGKLDPMMSEPSSTSLGEVMRAARTVSLRRMGEITGIDFGTLSEYETGTRLIPSRETLRAIAKGYGLSLRYLAELVYLGEPQRSTAVTADTRGNATGQDDRGQSDTPPASLEPEQCDPTPKLSRLKRQNLAATS